LIFLTREECQKWVSGRQLQEFDRGLIGDLTSYPKEAFHYYGLAEIIAEKCFLGDDVLLVITEWGIWSSNENLHLYYRLRQSYKDFRLLYDAPGHLFLKHEKVDMISFLQLSMLNGWGGYVVTQACDFGLFFSHDEYVAPFGNAPAAMAEFSTILKGYCS